MSGIRLETGHQQGQGKPSGLRPKVSVLRSPSCHSPVALALRSRVSWLLNNTDMKWMCQCREKGMDGAGGQGVALGFDSIIIISYPCVLVWG